MSRSENKNRNDGKSAHRIWKWIFGVVLLLQTGLFLLILYAGRDNASPDSSLVCLELLTFVVTFDIMLLLVRSVQRKKDQLQKQLLEQEFTARLGQKQEQAHRELERDAGELAVSLRKELECARKHLLEAGDGVPVNLTSDMDSDQWDHSFCQNAIVNAALRDKAAVCAESKIVLEHQVTVPVQMKVSEYHLCSVFANLLDNAIEACGTLPEGQRWIFVTSEVYGVYLCIRVRNSSSPAHANRPKREGHGLGLEIVRSIAKEYDGELKIERGEEEFVADVVMKVE